MSDTTPRFAIRDLSAISVSSTLFTYWHVKLGDRPLSIIYERNWFADASDMMKPGDVILATGSCGGAHVVVTNSEYDIVRVQPLEHSIF